MLASSPIAAAKRRICPFSTSMTTGSVDLPMRVLYGAVTATAFQFLSFKGPIVEPLAAGRKPPALPKAQSLRSSKKVVGEADGKVCPFFVPAPQPVDHWDPERRIDQPVARRRNQRLEGRETDETAAVGRDVSALDGSAI